MAHLNRCVDQIRQEVKSKSFLAKLNSYQRSSNKNYKELTEYVDALFERHARLLVLMVDLRSEEHTSELQSLMRLSYAVFCLKNTIHKVTPSTILLPILL